MTLLTKLPGILILLISLSNVACSDQNLSRSQDGNSDLASKEPTIPTTSPLETNTNTPSVDYSGPMLPSLLIQIVFAQPGASNSFRTLVSLNLQNGAGRLQGFAGLGCKLTEKSTGRTMLQVPLANGGTTNEMLIYGMVDISPGEMFGGFSNGGYANSPQPVEGQDYEYDCRLVLGQTPVAGSFTHINDLGLPTVVRNVGTLHFANNAYMRLSEMVYR